MKNQKKWLLRIQDETLIKEYTDKYNINEIIARLLYNRGLNSPEKIKDFFDVDISKLHNPYLLFDMDKGVRRIKKAVKSKEKITIYGDYDVDGVTSTSVLYLYLKSLGVNVDFYIPARDEEGYGMNKNALEKIADGGTSLIITVDTGITACEETEYAKALGVDIVITDHHECKETVPCAEAVINPRNPECNYPYKELAGVGVVFKLICALAGDEDKKSVDYDKVSEICNKYLDIIAIGTIADVMALNGENRIIVSNGLKRIAETENIGIKALMSISGIEKSKIKSSDIGFNLAPKINAAGRIGSASRAVELFICEKHSEASAIANELYQENIRRKETENGIYQEAIKKVEEQNNIKENKAIVLAGENWNNGVIGIVASRICEKYNLPTVLITYDGNEYAKGSGRSIDSFNLYKAFESLGPVLEKYGGHELAAGLTLKKENIDLFREKLCEYANETISEEMLVSNIEIDCKINAPDINLTVAKELEVLSPCGMANPVPVFELDGVKICDITMIGSDKHIKLLLEKDGNTFSGLFFNCRSNEFEYAVGDKINIVFNMEINNFRNVESVQAVIRDIALNETDLSVLNSAKLLYDGINKYLTGDFDINEKIIDGALVPNRNDFVGVYRYLLQNKISGNNIYLTDLLSRKIKNSSGRNIDYFKCRICLDVFSELGLIVCSYDGEYVKIKVIDTNNKIDLSDSKILMRLKKMSIKDKR